MHGSPRELLRASNNSVAQGFYVYDGLGRRVESNESSNYLFYAYLGTETMADLASGSPSDDYVYATVLRIANVTGNSATNPITVYYRTVVPGSTRLVISSTRSAVFSDSYQPHGKDN